MNQENEFKGYDAAPSLKEEDYLNRWSFAKEIYSIAKTTPNDWSVRIGVYGGWGEGKTGVLKFVETMAYEDKQIVVWFNPWEYTTPEDLWESFVTLILEKLKESGIKTRINRIKAKNLTKKAVDVIQPIADINPIMRAGLPFLKSYLKTNKAILKEIPNTNKDNKVIVLIDDLDRANPNIIPQLLFAVKELLDLPGFSFVLAFDPEVVNETLKAHNVNYGQGKDFLDKIIDFPKWLPKPTDENLLSLLKSIANKYIPFIDFNFILQIFPFIDKNPRKLKQLVRLFIGFKNELDRYNKDEINWTLFLLIGVFKIKYLQVIEPIFNNEKIINGLNFEKNFRYKQKGSDKEQEYILEIKKIIKKGKLDKQESEIIQLFKKIINADIIFTSESLMHYAYLSERPSIMTWKEFNILISNYEKDKNIQTLNQLINNFQQSSEYVKQDILTELLVKVIQSWDGNLSQASNSKLNEELNNYADNALLCIDLMEKICFNNDGLVGDKPFLNNSHFEKIYGIASHWAHFTMPNEVYAPIRKKEKDLLLKICYETTTDLIKILSYLKPWSRIRSNPFNSVEEKDLCVELSQIIEKRISEDFLEKFKIDNWSYSIISKDINLIEHHILLRKSSYFWSSDIRAKFLRLLKTETKSDTVSRNMYYFLLTIHYAFLDKDRSSFILITESILQDKELISEIWKSATLFEINPRMFKGLDDIRKQLMDNYNIELTLPSWWEKVERIILEKEKEVQNKD
jgi:hypothetical protein